jgi:hypothetical protein
LLASTLPITASRLTGRDHRSDAKLITAHSEKGRAAATFKRGVGFQPLWAFADHGRGQR